MTVKSENEITEFAAQQSEDTTKFEYKLTERRRVKIETGNPPKEFTKIERFKVRGTAVYRNGKRFLVTLQRTLKPAENVNELDDAFNFDMAILKLVVEEQTKKSNTKAKLAKRTKN